MTSRSGETRISTERWRAIAGYQGLYEVSDHGRVRSIAFRSNVVPHRPRIKILSQHLDKRGRLTVVFSKLNKLTSHRVHRLVLEAFVGPCPIGMETAHHDGDSKNNRLTNLRWATLYENRVLDKIRHGRYDTTPRCAGCSTFVKKGGKCGRCGMLAAAPKERT